VIIDQDSNPLILILINKGENTMIRKQFTLMIAVIFLICLLNACSSKDPDRYYSKKDGFSIKLPMGWETKEEYRGFSVMSFCPQGNSAEQNRSTVSVYVVGMGDSEGLEELFDRGVAKIKPHLTNFQSEKGYTSIDETDAKWLIFSGDGGTMNLKGKYYYMVHDKQGFVIAYLGIPDNYDRYKRAFEETALSFEFE
jgi:hypothetical protein